MSYSVYLVAGVWYTQHTYTTVVPPGSGRSARYYLVVPGVAPGPRWMVCCCSYEYSVRSTLLCHIVDTHSFIQFSDSVVQACCAKIFVERRAVLDVQQLYADPTIMVYIPPTTPRRTRLPFVDVVRTKTLLYDARAFSVGLPAYPLRSAADSRRSSNSVRTRFEIHHTYRYEIACVRA